MYLICFHVTCIDFSSALTWFIVRKVQVFFVYQSPFPTPLSFREVDIFAIVLSNALGINWDFHLFLFCARIWYLSGSMSVIFVRCFFQYFL